MGDFLYVIRAFFNQLLRAVPAHIALFEKLNAFSSTKNCKNTCCLGGFSFLKALNLEKWGVEALVTLILFPSWWKLLSKRFDSNDNWSLTCAEHVLLFSKSRNIKTKTCMSCKELFDKQCALLQYKVETHNFNFYLNRIKV